MSTIVTTDVREAIEEVCHNNGFDIIEYSGRCMYGKTCLGITLEDTTDTATFFVRLCMAGYESDALDLANDMRTDSMGLGMVIYFPGISFAGFTEDDN